MENLKLAIDNVTEEWELKVLRDKFSDEVFSSNHTAYTNICRSIVNIIDEKLHK